MTGDSSVIDTLFSILDVFPSWLPIASHDVKPGEESDLR